MDPIKFPARDVPLIGEPCTTHPCWFVTIPITCNCPAKTPLVVYAGNALPPAICPACLNVYGVVAIQGGGPKNLPFGVAVQVIGRAQKKVEDDAVGNITKQILETVN